MKNLDSVFKSRDITLLIMVQQRMIVGWHHRLNGHEFEQAAGDGERTGKTGMLQSMGLQRVGHD